MTTLRGPYKVSTPSMARMNSDLVLEPGKTMSCSAQTTSPCCAQGVREGRLCQEFNGVYFKKIVKLTIFCFFAEKELTCLRPSFPKIL